MRRDIKKITNREEELYTEEELLRMSKNEATEGLNSKQIAFCQYFVTGHNQFQAAIKAGYTVDTARSHASNIRRKPECKRYIAWLKIRATKNTLINASELLEKYVRIAFSDITDFVDIFPNRIQLKPSEQIDGQLVKSIKSGREGISIELHDKMNALDFLSRYVEDMPKDWKQKIEERKLELMEKEFEFKKEQNSFQQEQVYDDGFIEAIKRSTDIIWEEE